MKRRKFIQMGSLASLGLLTANSCVPKKKTMPGEIVGASSGIGHMLRDKTFGEPVSTQQTKVVIVGGGISGLSAARWLKKNGIDDFILLDLEKETGGNAAHGKNETTAYPWGAHYIPTPNNDLKAYLDFLEECNVITGRNEAGLPVYNEYYLCFDPQERLYINGSWQDGLIPNLGLPANDKQEMARFLQMMQAFRTAKGADNLDAFAIPIDTSSKDESYTKLDSITMQQWLADNNFHSSYVKWYVNYCTRDDFGTRSDLVSAWVGIHYFAARKGNGANAKHDDVITWPEGNGWLVGKLTEPIMAQVHTHALAVKAVMKDDKVSIHYYDVNDHQLKAIEATQCILAVPQFVAARLLPGEKERSELVAKNLHYTPWMVANLVLTSPEERNGAPFSWDNVLYDGKGLGYVEATHQQLQQLKSKLVITYYLPLTDNEPVVERKAAYTQTHADWVKRIIDDLKMPHPDIEEKTERIDVMVWGHAMAQPLPGIAHGPVRKQLQQSIGNQIHFAHTDLAGISIFEEAFYQGLNAAKKVLANFNMQNQV